jgi:hypothetical protein
MWVMDSVLIPAHHPARESKNFSSHQPQSPQPLTALPEFLLRKNAHQSASPRQSYRGGTVCAVTIVLTLGVPLATPRLGVRPIRPFAATPPSFTSHAHRGAPSDRAGAKRTHPDVPTPPQLPSATSRHIAPQFIANSAKRTQESFCPTRQNTPNCANAPHPPAPGAKQTKQTHPTGYWLLSLFNQTHPPKTSAPGTPPSPAGC